MNILLLGSYELGRQPFGLASPAAWLRARGHAVRCFDLSRQPLEAQALRAAGLIVFYLPMHTATRLALAWTAALRAENPAAHLAACGIYAPLNEARLREAGFATVLGPEFEPALAALADELASGGARAPVVPAGLPRVAFQVPDRSDLPSLDRYAHLVLPDGSHRIAGYTEASRGCKHLCRHCPIVPVYGGRFRAVPREVVLADIRQQVQAGARHITFGDPDFFNGVTHAVRLVEELHREFPRLSYDVTVKIEHLLAHQEALATLVRTGCLFVTSAVESLEDEVLEKLRKGHTRADFLRALDLVRRAGLALQPTFVPFTPWTTRAGYAALLEAIADLDLIASVGSIQLAIRLLIPARSPLVELPDVAAIVGDFDPGTLVYPWRHRDPAVDALAETVAQIVARAEREKSPREATFERIREAASALAPRSRRRPLPRRPALGVPYLTEPWYC